MERGREEGKGQVTVECEEKSERGRERAMKILATVGKIA